MKPRLLAICGSPRRGNTEWMLEELVKVAARNGAEAELILLRKQDIKRCNGCLACEAGGYERKGVCTIRDDMQTIYPRLLAADALVLGTPVYFEMLSGLMKDFLDRTCPVWPALHGKAMAGVAVAEEGIGDAVKNLKTYASVCGLRWAGSVTALAKGPGEVSRDAASIRPRLSRLAGKVMRAASGGSVHSGGMNPGD